MKLSHDQFEKTAQKSEMCKLKTGNEIKNSINLSYIRADKFCASFSFSGF